MRIGYFTNTYPRATDTFIQREVMGLRERGIDVRTFSVHKTGTDHDVGPEVIAEKKNTFYVLPVNPFRLLALNLSTLVMFPTRYLHALSLALKTARPGLAGLIYQLFYFQEAVVISRELRRHKIHHLHNHLGDLSGTVAMLASSIAGIGFSMTVHGSDFYFDPTHWALREKVKLSRFIICISHYCKSQMMLFSDQEDWNRLKIVHCGIDPDRFGYAGVRETAKNLLYVGRLAVEKGIPVLFESLSMLKDRGHDFVMTMVGDGPDRVALEEMALRLRISDRIIFAGYAGQDKVKEYLQKSDILILPSFAEGVPVTLMEAMACGIPVIGTQVGGVPELIVHDQTGQLVPPADSISLADAIIRYLDNTELRERVSRQGREKVVKDFNLNSELDKLMLLFQQHVIPISNQR